MLSVSKFIVRVNVVKLEKWTKKCVCEKFKKRASLRR